MMRRVDYRRKPGESLKFFQRKVNVFSYKIPRLTEHHHRPLELEILQILALLPGTFHLTLEVLPFYRAIVIEKPKRQHPSSFINEISCLM